MTRIINLNKIICTLKKFGNDNKITKDGLFGEIVKKPQIGEGRCQKIAYEKHIKICLDLGFLKEEKDSFVLTEFGQEFYNTIPTKNRNQKFIDIVNDELKKKLIKKIIERRKFIKTEMGGITTDVKIENGESKFFINNTYQSKISRNVRELLKELGLILYEQGQYQVSSKIGSHTKQTK